MLFKRNMNSSYAPENTGDAVFTMVNIIENENTLFKLTVNLNNSK